MSFSITGLVSGLDTAQIVKDLMEVERIPYTNLETRRSQLQSEQTVFRQINTKLKALDDALFDLKYSFNLKAYKATSSSESITATSTNDAVPGKYNITVVTAAKEATAKTSSNDLIQAIRDGDFKLGDIDFSDPELRNQLKIDESSNDEALLKSVVNYINANSTAADATVTMLKKDDGSYSMQFTSLDSADVQIESEYLKETGSNRLSVTDGTQAEFLVNGEKYYRNSNKIDGIIPGVTFTLSSDNTSSTITIEADADKVAAKVQTFVGAYNDLISTVRTNLATPENTKETVNPLQGDSLLKDINSRLYSIFNQFTSAGFMEDIGLSIDKGVTKGSDMTGKITFDKEAFTAALTENPSKVNTILTSVSTDMSNTISKSWTSTVSGVLSTKITGYDAELKRVDERLEAMDRSLQMKEARLKQQFSTMEVMMSSLQSTQKWLTSQFETLTKSNK